MFECERKEQRYGKECAKVLEMGVQTALFLSLALIR